MYRSLRHPTETFRTAPVALTGAAFNMSVASACIAGIVESDNIIMRGAELGVALYSLGAAAVKAAQARDKIEFRNHVESILDMHGFDDRLMAVTTQTYCGRQAARVACQNYGYTEEYARLCAQNVEESDFTRLPHI